MTEQKFRDHHIPQENASDFYNINFNNSLNPYKFDWVSMKERNY